PAVESCTSRSHSPNGVVFNRTCIPIEIDDAQLGRLWTYHDVTPHHRASAAMRSQLSRDALTGLASRDRFLQRLDLLNEGLEPFVLIMFDLDGFKQVNDVHGHAAGDMLLSTLGARLLTAFREHDTIGRLGGDEFALLVETNSREAAAHVAEKILTTVGQPVRLASGDEVRVGASVGVTFRTPTQSPRELLEHADAAMYAAKASGKN